MAQRFTPEKIKMPRLPNAPIQLSVQYAGAYYMTDTPAYDNKYVYYTKIHYDYVEALNKGNCKNIAGYKVIFNNGQYCFYKKL